MYKKLYILLLLLITNPLFTAPQIKAHIDESTIIQSETVDVKDENISTKRSAEIHDYSNKLKTHQNCLCDFCNELHIKTKLKSITTETKVEMNQKEWTFMVYIAADNDLRGFAARNIRQMAAIGSNENINIIVHLDIKMTGNKKVSRFYYIEKNRILHLNIYDEQNLPMDSGNPQTLIAFCAEAITNFPAKRYALICWNHGTGAINPAPRGRAINPSLLFSYNPATHKLELDRSIGFLDYVCNQKADSRGVCWDDTTGNYLTNEDLARALGFIRKNYMNGQKFHIIGFDACLMAMVEVYSLMKDHAYIMVSSQEVILGTGWNYLSLLYPFSNGTLNSKEFAYHMVASYDQSYNKITNDYTLSAIKLYRMKDLENNIDIVGKILAKLIQKDNSGKIKRLIQKCRNKRICTHFDEPSYIDLYHFYQNIHKYVCAENQPYTQQIKQLLAKLKKQIETGFEIMNKTIIAYAAGKNLSNAHGTSIYLPYRHIHSSYKKNNFFNTNGWGKFVRSYV